MEQPVYIYHKQNSLYYIASDNSFGYRYTTQLKKNYYEELDNYKALIMLKTGRNVLVVPYDFASEEHLEIIAKCDDKLESQLKELKNGK